MVFREESAFNVQTCPGYLENVFIGDSSSRSRFETWLQELEVENKCSGICETAYFDPTDQTHDRAFFYLFSNVNNGKPKISCRQPILDNVVQQATFYVYMMLSITVTSGISLISVVLVLMWPRICKKKPGDSGRKERAANGMVIPPLGGNDFDEIPSADKQNDVELAEIKHDKQTEKQTAEAAEAKRAYAVKEKAISDLRRDLGMAVADAKK